MNLILKVDSSTTRKRRFVWTIRSDDDVVASTIMAVGYARTEAEALSVGRVAHAALSAIFTVGWKHRAEHSFEKARFDAIRETMTATLAEAIEQQLSIMGDDAKGISWFSSNAQVIHHERDGHGRMGRES